MAKALGVGGVFFRTKDPKALGAWYAKWLGLPVDESWGGVAFQPGDVPEAGATVWSPFAHDTDYFDTAREQQFMLNLMVDDLDGALAQVAEGGAEIVGEVQDYDYGRFGWFVDPAGYKVELWQPKAMPT